MIVEIGNSQLQLPYIAKEGLYEGKIKSIEDVEKDKEGNPVKTPYSRITIESKAGTHTESLYLTASAAIRIKDMWYYLMGQEITGNFDTSKLQQLVGMEVFFKIIPQIDKSSGKVYYKFSYTNFIRKIEDKNSLIFSARELESIKEANEHLASVTSEQASPPSTSTGGDLPF